MDANQLAQCIDELAAIRAEIAELRLREETRRDFLIAAGVTEADGTLHRATVSTAYPVRVDWQTIAQKLEPSRQLIAAHTSRATDPVYTVRVTARKTH